MQKQHAVMDISIVFDDSGMMSSELIAQIIIRLRSCKHSPHAANSMCLPDVFSLILLPNTLEGQALAMLCVRFDQYTAQCADEL